MTLPLGPAATRLVDAARQIGLSPQEAAALVLISPDGERLHQHPGAMHRALAARGAVDAAGPNHDRSGYVTLTPLGRVWREQLAAALRGGGP